jgi:hypothetical protein
MTGKIVTCRRSTRPAAMRVQFSDKLACERRGTSDSRLSRATISTASPLTMVASGQPRVSRNVDEITVAGIRIVRTFHSSSVLGSMPEDMICAVSRKVVAPKTMRCSVSNMAARCASSSGPCLLQ